jgi:hypothetical protein
MSVLERMRAWHSHDNLKAITLRSRLIAAPPLELLPEVTARILIPQDIEQGLILPLTGQVDALF